ncbi:hypothetical protein KUTeg_014419 [Tegillarca granosa]|uniref:VWFA domain-containing protein n=1 Tax=Tegillarca granosa TaxID=220873 RepID=A0ABQ9EWH4_TEGGR|nr:hypothetical protein KUTeg_014419 [Tegillarca granosa]
MKIIIYRMKKRACNNRFDFINRFICSSKKADIVFLLDSSSSEGQINFQKQLDFVKDFVRQFDIGRQNVQVGVVTFSTSAHNEFWLNDFTNKNDVLYALSSIKYSIGNTNTGQALQFVKNNSFSSNHGARGPDVEKILIVLTDGQSMNSTATINAAKQVHNQGIHTISIGIGTGVNQNELQAIATDPSQVFTVQNFTVLSSIKKELSQVTCNTTTKCQAKADIAFVLDTSGSVGSANFQKQLDFVSKFVKSFPVGPTETQFSVLLFSDGVYNKFYFNDIRDITSLNSALRNITYLDGNTYTDKALNFVSNTTFAPQHGSRNDSKHIAIVMTDGQSSSPSATKVAAAALHKTGVEVMSIGIGSSVTLSELQTIASDNQHVFQVISFDALTTIQSELEKTACEIAKPVCSTKQADIVFLVDSSSSEGQANFDKQIDFIKNFVKQFDIGPNNVQIGVVTFASVPHNEFWLNDFQTKADVMYALSSIKYSSGNTFTNTALDFVRNSSFSPTHGARGPNVDKILIVLTDGQSTNSTATTTASQQIHAKGIHTISIGIGTGVNQNELQAIATDPSQVFTVQNFNVLSSIQKELSQWSQFCLYIVCNLALFAAMVILFGSLLCFIYHRFFCSSYFTVCGDATADIVFILDSSGSEGQDNFEKQLHFVGDFVKQFQIGPNAVQIGMVTFSSNARDDFYFNTYHDKQSLLNKILNAPYLGETTNTEEGLKYARLHHFDSKSSGARPEAKKIAIVMTDGKSDSRSFTLQEATQLKNLNVTVLAIGIGTNVDQSELQGIASDRLHVFNVSGFDALQSIQHELKNRACVCDAKMVDIIFLLDSSTSEGQPNFQKQIDFVKDFVKQFTIGPDKIQVGVVTFASNPQNQFWLNDFLNNPDLQYALSSIKYSSGDTYTGKALAFVKDNSFSPSHGARGPDVEKLLIVFTDGKSLDSTSTISAAKQVHNMGIHTISIGIGDSVNQNELQAIATDPSEVFTVQNFNVLSSLQKDLTAATCNLTTICGDKPADIVFILDASGSEGETNFHKQLDFVGDFVKKFQIGPNAIQIGMVTFSTNARNDFYFNTYHDRLSLLNKLQNVVYLGDSTKTNLGLKYARQYHFESKTSGARPNVKKIAIVMTDGNSDSTSDTIREADFLKNTGVTVISIGIGSECGYTERADIIFALDASGSEGSTNFQKQLDFVSKFVQDFTIGPNNVQFSVLTFGVIANNEFYLNEYLDRSSLLRAVQTVHYADAAKTNTEKALQFIESNTLLPIHGARPAYRQFVIVMTDGKSGDKPATLSAANNLKRHTNVTVVSIGIGSDVDRTELEGIATDSSHVFTSQTFDALTAIKSDRKQLRHNTGK